VHPLWETWAELVYPDCDDVIAIMEYNRDWYSNSIPPSSPGDVTAASLLQQNCSSPTDRRPKFTFEPTNAAS